WVDGSTAWAADARADGLGQGGEIETLAEIPDDACLVIRIQEILQGHGGDDLLAINTAQAGRLIARSTRGRRSFAHGSIRKNVRKSIFPYFTKSGLIHSL